MKPICVKCKLFFKPERNGTYFEEGKPTSVGWASYKLWVGDMWKCKGCGVTIVVGVGASAISEHYMPDYKEQVALFKPAFRVDDC